jgi:hypothetical protein
MRYASKTVVADDSVCDEIARASCYVVHGKVETQGLDRDHLERTLILDRLTFDGPLAENRRIDRVEEA